MDIDIRKIQKFIRGLDLNTIVGWWVALHVMMVFSPATSDQVVIGAIGPLATIAINIAISVAFGIAAAALGRQTTTNRGPRLDDLAVSSSTVGTPIPIGFGTMRQAGNIIWSPGISETEEVEVEKVGGFFGLFKSTIRSVTYIYSAQFAIAFGEGPAQRMEKVWFDKKMVYDVTSTNVDTVDPDIKFTFYPGTETQTRDPLIVADVGEFSTSAHRGLIYAVFDIPLTDYGNRIPNIEAAIAYTGSADTFPFDVMNEITVAEGGLFDTVNTFDFAIDYLRGRMFLLDNTVTEGMRRANWNTMAEDFQLGESDVLTTGGVLDLMHTSPDGFVYMTTDEGTNSGPIARINPDDLTEVDRFGASGSSGSLFQDRM